MRFQQQVDEIVKVYTEKYFASCEKNHVRILWEPYAGGPNIATGPVGWEALFKAFQDSPHVGLQFDPSHLVWQFMDPVAAAREFAAKIYDVHLKDTEILWYVVKRAGIQPVNRARWWRFRLPGNGSSSTRTSSTTPRTTVRTSRKTTNAASAWRTNSSTRWCPR
jgi:sugar phosphate isomerase/epimerase